MWIAVTIFNPLLALLALFVIPVQEVNNFQATLLSELGYRTAGIWLRFWVSLDAAIVLSGAVLTAYVGVGGLLSRMTLDRVLPEFLTQKKTHVEKLTIG